MPRKPTSPIQAQTLTLKHCADATTAARLIADILNGRWAGPDDKRADALHGAAKVLEATERMLVR